MKLLLDENLSRRLVPFLQHDYPGSNQVLLLGMESATDKEVWQKAKDDDYVIVTRDADFQELSLVWFLPCYFTQKWAHPGRRKRNIL